MALVRRQSINFEIFDDQSPTLWNSFVGNWTRYGFEEGFNNNTLTVTPTPGASLSFTFSGSQAWLYGGLLANASTTAENQSYPAAEYKVDGFSAGAQQPWLDTNGAVVYFQTPELADGTHKIDITVTTANLTNQYILDFFLISPSAGGDHAGVSTSRSVPTPSSSSSSLPIVTSQSTPVGAIVGGVVGGIAGIAILIFALWYFLRKRSSGGQAYYFDKPTPGDMLAGEDHVEPFNATPATTPAPSSAGFGGQGPHSAYSDSSSQPLNPSFGQTVTDPSRYSQSEAGQTYVSGTSGQPRVGKAALIAQQNQGTQQPVQFQDSGIRFNENGEQEAGPSQLPTEVPPTYTPN